MKIQLLTAVSAFLVLSSTASLAEDCVAPEAPTLIEGEESSMEQMLEAQKAVKAFQTANLAYMDCLAPQLDAAEADAKEGVEGAVERYSEIQQSYNDAVSREEAVAEKFNTEIRDYKAANPG
ncbi:MAG: hypothetical protein AAGF57_15560 [Pseudomonadota bacterium]